MRDIKFTTGQVQVTAINGGPWSEDDLCSSTSGAQEEIRPNVSKGLKLGILNTGMNWQVQLEIT